MVNQYLTGLYFNQALKCKTLSFVYHNLASKTLHLYKSMSCEYFAELKNDDNFLHKPEMKLQESGETDGQTDKQTTIMC